MVCDLAVCDDRVQHGPVPRSGSATRKAVQWSRSCDLVTRVLFSHVRKIGQQRLHLSTQLHLKIPNALNTTTELVLVFGVIFFVLRCCFILSAESIWKRFTSIFMRSPASYIYLRIQTISWSDFTLAIRRSRTALNSFFFNYNILAACS